MSQELVKRDSSAVSTLENGSGEDIQRMLAFSEHVCKAKFITKEARGDAASTFFLVAIAQDLGMRWTHGLRSLYMTPDGKVGMQGDIALALVQSKGFKVQFVESTEEKAVVSIERPDGSVSHTETFTMADAARVKIKNRDNKWIPMSEKYNYRSYPKNMLRWRAFMNCARLVAADVLGGIYLPEELEAIALGKDEEEQYDGATSGPTPEDPNKIQVGEFDIVVDPETDQKNAAPESDIRQADPEPEKKEAPSIAERWKAVNEVLNLKENGAGKRFVAGWHGITDLRKVTNDLGNEEVLAALESCDPKEFAKDPMAYGKALRGGNDEAQATDSGDDDMSDLDREVQAVCKARKMTEEKLIEWIKTHGMAEAGDEELTAFLKIFRLTLQAPMVAIIARKNGVSIARQILPALDALSKPYGFDNNPKPDVAVFELAAKAEANPEYFGTKKAS